MLRRIIAAALAVLAVPAAADGRQWMAFTDIPEPVASYGTPESDDVEFSIACSGGGSLLIDPRILLPVRPAWRVSIGFTIDGVSTVRPATVSPDVDENDGGYPTYVRVPVTDPLVEMMQHGSRLTAALVPTARRIDPTEVPLRGSRKAIDRVLARC